MLRYLFLSYLDFLLIILSNYKKLFLKFIIDIFMLIFFWKNILLYIEYKVKLKIYSYDKFDYIDYKYKKIINIFIIIN